MRGSTEQFFLRARDARFWFFLILWIANDHIFKAAFADTPLTHVTGKLSDVASLIVFPVAMASALHWLTCANRRTLTIISAACTGLLFVAINLDQAWSDALHGLLPEVGGGVFRGTADVTDLLCLPLLLVPIYGGRKHAKPHRHPAFVEIAGVVLCALTTTATSFAFPPREIPIVPVHPITEREFAADDTIVFVWFLIGDENDDWHYAEYRLVLHAADTAEPMRTLVIPEQQVELRTDPRTQRTARLYRISARQLKLTPGEYYWQLTGDGLGNTDETFQCTQDEGDFDFDQRGGFFCRGDSDPALLRILPDA